LWLHPGEQVDQVIDQVVLAGKGCLSLVGLLALVDGIQQQLHVCKLQNEGLDPAFHNHVGIKILPFSMQILTSIENVLLMALFQASSP
jgi:hypothetical protein